MVEDGVNIEYVFYFYSTRVYLANKRAVKREGAHSLKSSRKPADVGRGNERRRRGEVKPHEKGGERIHGAVSGKWANPKVVRVAEALSLTYLCSI
jgi:hypothetical protein